MQESIIYKLKIWNQESRDNFASSLIENLDSINPTGLRKKIINCSIELIQNNIKHNTHFSELSICEDKDFYTINITEQIEIKNYLKIKSKIDKINQFTLDGLQDIFKNNLTKNAKNTGNGLIFCRLKSANPISIKNLKSDKNLNDIKISLKFNKS